MGTQAGIGGCHFPWRHLETWTLLMMWYPGSQKKWMVLFWGKPRHGDGSQRKPPCSGTRGWVQLLSRPVETQRGVIKATCLKKEGKKRWHSCFVLFTAWAFCKEKHNIQGERVIDDEWHWCTAGRQLGDPEGLQRIRSVFTAYCFPSNSDLLV